MHTPVSRATAPQFTWAEVCAGWRLVATDGLSVVEERMPPGTAERRHYHERARQFFYVLAGEAALEVEGVVHALRAGEGLEVAPGERHTFMNRSAAELRFLVISAPNTTGDRIEVA